MPSYSTIERAFQLARSGECSSIDDLRSALSREGYLDALAQTSFPFVRKQLRDLLQGRAASAPPKSERRSDRRRKPGMLNLQFEQT